MKLLAWIFPIAVLAAQEDAATRQAAAVEAQKRGILLQRNSVRRQIQAGIPASGSFFVTLDDIAPTGADCEPLSPVRARTLVEAASKRAGISTDLLDAVIRQESGFRPCSVSLKGAKGLMQLMPAVAEEWGVEDPFDPDSNVAAGAGLLKQLIDRYAGDMNRALGAYNAGPQRVDEAGGVPQIPETMHYVQTILGRLKSQN